MYEHDPISHRIIGCAIEVHRVLGPGLPEGPYEEALCRELRDAGLEYVRQLSVPVIYKEQLVGEYRPDLVVENRIIVEIKSVERLIGVHKAQVLTYMRLLNLPVGLILNFYGQTLRTGIKRLAL
jgi:GxxExxY protein